MLGARAPSPAQRAEHAQNPHIKGLLLQDRVRASHSSGRGRPRSQPQLAWRFQNLNQTRSRY
jgi:hypothetical protein